MEQTIFDSRKIEEFLDDFFIKKLQEGRTKNLRIESLKNLPALDLYTGNLYQVSGFKDAVRNAVQKGIHCLVLSAGYGLIRTDEYINSYNRTMNQAKASWTKENLLPDVFSNYLTRNKISKVFITASRTTYVPALFYQNGKTRFDFPKDCEVFVYIPENGGSGSPLKEIPRMQGEAVRDIINNGMKPDSRWKKE